MHAAYFAGIVDGEGSILLPYTGVRKLEGMPTSYSPQVIVTNTNLGLLEALQKEWGGYMEHYTNKGANCKPAHRLKWRGANAMAVVDVIYDDLIIKKAQCDLLRAYWGLRSMNSGSGSGVSNSLEMVKQSTEIALMVKRLNKRGL